MTDPLAQAGVEVFHHFGEGTYIKETRIPKGVFLLQHQHPHAHQSVVASGKCRVTVDGVSTDYKNFAVLFIGAEKAHKVEALSDVVWLCIHATEEKDPTRIDTRLLSRPEMNTAQPL